MALTKQQMELKKTGFLPQKQKDMFSLRIKITGGQVAADLLPKLQQIANQYGKGYVHLTSRQSIEIPFIKLEDVPAVRQALAEGDMEASGTDACVRTITACQGSAVCGSGNIDTTDLAMKIEERFGGRELNHKFKIGITGCRNNCLKAEENDLGIKGAMTPLWNKADCVYCGACDKRCPVDAIYVDRETKTLTYDAEKCVHCGRCVRICPKSAWEGKPGYLVYFGGLFGNMITQGEKIYPVVYDEIQLFAIINQTLLFFKEHGKKGERFHHTLERVGWDAFYQHLHDVLPLPQIKRSVGRMVNNGVIDRRRWRSQRLK